MLSNERRTMKPSSCLIPIALLGALALAVGAPIAAMSVHEEASDDSRRKAALRELQRGNAKDALEILRPLATASTTSSEAVPEDLSNAVACLQQLGLESEADELIEASVAAHPTNWRLLERAATLYEGLPHYGYIVAGEFERGRRRSGGRGGEYANSQTYDRHRALQLLEEARVLLAADADASDGERSAFWFHAARTWNGSGWAPAWRLQILTDLDDLPEIRPGYSHGWSDRGAPVDADGNPVFYALPETFDRAANDGERWRYCLEQAAVALPSARGRAQFQLAEFAWGQFGVQTCAGRLDSIASGDDDTAGPFAFPSLGDDETIARLANGIQRFELPEDYRYIRVLRSIADRPNESFAEASLGRMAQIFENRLQYPKAAAIWLESIERFGDDRPRPKRQRYEQITGNWGQFLAADTQSARSAASVDFRFRNGNRVDLTAQRVDIERLLRDIKDHLKSRPSPIDAQLVNIGNIGARIVRDNERKYVGATVAEWTLDLEPREDHFDRTITIQAPLRDAGAYLITAKMADGNRCSILLWLADMAIVRKQMESKVLFYVADAITGAPIERATLEMFGYRFDRQKDRRRPVVQTRNFAEFTSRDGTVVLDVDHEIDDYQWLAHATDESGRAAFLGFDRIWGGRQRDTRYDQMKLFTMTDRPVYRPGDIVHFKHWYARARYDIDANAPSEVAGREFVVKIHDPLGEAIFETTLRADDYGGFAGDFTLDADAKLGQYRIEVQGCGSDHFRVEEYKKPEYEVTVDAPDEAVALGDTLTATIRARYYFGAPVTEGTVHYKVHRSTRSHSWYPIGRWDWLYGRGYGWLGCDRPWYPGFETWGCFAPIPIWWNWSPDPPELVIENEVELGPDGTVEVEIDTALAKALYGDRDHEYRITAEVVDRSRRTVVGTGRVSATREPFRVYAWVDRGFYRAGDTIEANFRAQTIDGKPIEGSGVARLLSIRYDENGAPVETEIERYELPTNANGEARLSLTAGQAGQYRIAYTLTNASGASVEGGALVLVLGEGFDGSDFRFDALELLVERSEYAPGDTVKLVINTNRIDSTVLLFLRPENGSYAEPKVLRLRGKTTTYEFEVERGDMPNFFVEALTVANGRIYRAVREIVVPPESRVLGLEVEPDASEYAPGAPASVRLRLTDADGEPFVGTTVVAIYDRALEAIAGGSNVDDIRAHFWKWRRSHYPQESSNLQRRSGNLIRANEIGMSPIGTFGYMFANDTGGDTWGAEKKLGKSARGQSAAEASAPASGALRSLGYADGVESEQALEDFDQGDAAYDDGGVGDETLVEPTVRESFADTALWVASLTTDAEGRAEVSLDMPENLTTWMVRAWGLGSGTRVGEGTARVVTTKNLLLRLQAPRFFVEKDEVVLSANIHNYLSTAKDVRARLELEGDCLEPLGDTEVTVTVEASGETRVDWRVRAVREGEATIRMSALTDEESDAMQMKFPVHVHGMEKTESWAGVLRPEDESGSVTVRVPSERRPEQTRLEVRWSPTLAGAMVDALPYLVSYPYGCTEQTLNRFVPTVVTQKILLDMNLDLAAIRDKRTNLNAQELGDPNERAERWRRGDDRNPVFDEAEVLAMVKQGVADLTAMQNSDGGWGWFSGYGEQSWPHTTAVVVHGLQVAERNDVAIVPGVIDRGLAWLARYEKEEIRKLRNAATETRPYKTRATSRDAFVHAVLAEADRADAAMREFLFRDRIEAGTYANVLLALVLADGGPEDQLATVLQNLEQRLEQDDENQTAWLRTDPGYRWHWYGDEIEANAWYLKLLSKIDPKGDVASRLAKYLVNNRRGGTYWRSTRDTALVIEALADYMRASDEVDPDLTVEILVDGDVKKTVRITSENLFAFDSSLVLTGDALSTGNHVVELRKSGRGPLYYNAYLTNFTLEDPIAAAGLEVRVERTMYKLVRDDDELAVEGSRGQVTTNRVEQYRREPLVDFAQLVSGDLVEVELVIESKNDYEYLLFEDRKPAGFEPVSLQSGYDGNALRAYVEYRDDRVAFFVRELPRGRHSVAYRVRAEIPGQFSALPAVASGMYAPELRGNSDEQKIRIRD